MYANLKIILRSLCSYDQIQLQLETKLDQPDYTSNRQKVLFKAWCLRKICYGLTLFLIDLKLDVKSGLFNVDVQKWEFPLD